MPQEQMIRPEDIAEAALLPFRMSQYACPSGGCSLFSFDRDVDSRKFLPVPAQVQC